MNTEVLVMNTDELLMIDLPMNQLGLVREVNVLASRERTSEEKYRMWCIFHPFYH